MLARRLRRRPNIKTTSGKCLVLAGYSSRPDVYISELYECHILQNSRILTLINIYHILVQLRNNCSDFHDLDAIGSYLVVLIPKLIVLIPQVQQDVFT